MSSTANPLANYELPPVAPPPVQPGVNTAPGFTVPSGWTVNSSGVMVPSSPSSSAPSGSGLSLPSLDLGNVDPFYNPNLSSSLGLPSTASTSSGSLSAGDILGALGGAAIAGAAGTPTLIGPNAAAGANAASSMFGGFSIGRIGAFLLGLILIAGGIYLFKGVQETIVKVGKISGRAAALAAA